MFLEIKHMPYSTARYMVIKELDTRGHIGRLLLNYDHKLSLTMMDLCEWIDRAEIAFKNNEPNLIRWDMVKNACHMFTMFAEKFPFLVLLSSELDWSGFLSAWIVVIQEFTNVVNFHSQFIEEPRQKDEIMQNMSNLDSALQPIYKLMELGAGYMELIKASREIAMELRNWKQSQPAAMRLSSVYLQSLGVIDENEKPCEPDMAMMPDNPPPPPPHPEGHNPPPPPRCE